MPVPTPLAAAAAVQKNLQSAAAVIDSFSIDEDDYVPASREALAALAITVSGEAELAIYLRGSEKDIETLAPERSRPLALTLRGEGRGNRLFLNPGVHGAVTLGLEGSEGLVYLGRDSYFAAQHIGSRQDQDLIAVGNDVAVTGPGRWVSGLRSADSLPALIIGDACVLASDVILRNSDGHPIMDPALEMPLNLPAGPLLIEPHCWIGERAAILKNVTVGAFSIVGLAAVVTRTVPRHYRAAGNPAVLEPNGARVWCWDDSPDGLARAAHFLARYPLAKS